MKSGAQSGGFRGLTNLFGLAMSSWKLENVWVFSFLFFFFSGTAELIAKARAFFSDKIREGIKY